MFGLFKKKSEKEKLTDLYNKKKNQPSRCPKLTEKKVTDLKKKRMIF